MAYAIKPDESMARALRRIVRKQAQRALDDLDASDRARDETVHSARKRFKKIRAALRLWRGALRRRDYRRENVQFRDAARPLTEVRDAAVLLERLDELGQLPEVPRGEIDRAHQFLADRAAQTRRRLLEEEPALPHVADAVRQALDRVDALTVHGKGWRALAGGLARVYRDGRRAFARARAEPTDANLHEWRKQAKYLWHALQLLHACAPVVMDRLAEHAHQLGDLLGEDHDLAVLHESLAGTIDASSLLAQIDRRRAELQTAAQSMGRRVYGAKTARFTAKIGRRFRRWRRAAANV